MSTVLPDLYKIAENAAISSIDQAIPNNECAEGGDFRSPRGVRADSGIRSEVV
jgi:hypothetical protein